MSIRDVKHSILRHFPGAIGKKYDTKYFGRRAMPDFHAALEDCRGMTAIDLGANVGEFTRIMSDKSSKVIAFEPDPWCLDQLRANTADLTNVEIIAAAASTENGEMSLFRHESFEDDPLNNSQSSSLMSSKSNITLDGAHSVRTVDFLEFLRGLDSPVGVLKIDIEGAEVDILEHLFDDDDLGSRVKYIFCETHEDKIPEHKARVEALKKRASRMQSPKANLYWH